MTATIAASKTSAADLSVYLPDTEKAPSKG